MAKGNRELLESKIEAVDDMLECAEEDELDLLVKMLRDLRGYLEADLEKETE